MKFWIFRTKYKLIMNCLRNSKLRGIQIHNKSVPNRKNLFIFFVTPCFNILKMYKKIMKKIQSLNHFFGPRAYYKVKNKKNVKLQG